MSLSLRKPPLGKSPSGCSDEEKSKKREEDGGVEGLALLFESSLTFAGTFLHNRVWADMDSECRSLNTFCAERTKKTETFEFDKEKLEAAFKGDVFSGSLCSSSSSSSCDGAFMRQKRRL